MTNTRDRDTLLQIRDLRVRYDQAAADTLDRVSLSIKRQEAVALLGDSGCGKTTLALAMMRLLPNGAMVSGSIELRDGDYATPIELTRLAEDRLREVRGKRMAMLFQSPQRSLNPVLRIGSQIEEVIRVHTNVRRADARLKAIQSLTRVGITDPERIIRAWPHELSGGMAQRIGLAITLAGQPDLLIADEPTSSLDANAKAQVVELLRKPRRTMGMAILLITHDWTIARALADRVCVMDGNRIVEDRQPEEFEAHNIHPAARRLIDASNRRLRIAVTNGDDVR
ncbi:MAG: ABC transporter ATP-binding protein [Planctomycetes bacterium]|nr:ABC transporter ATP-binding protein [Planctomycetota bacterium]